MHKQTSLKDLAARELIPGFNGKMIHTDDMTLAYWDIKAGSVLPEHAHFHKQIAQVISGEFELTVDGKAYRMR